MIKQLTCEKDRFIDFSRNNKLLYVIIIFAIAFSYGTKIVGLNISIDTEVIIDNFDSQMGSWNSIGRLGLVALKRLFALHSFNPFVANFLTVVFLFFTCIFIGYLIWKVSDNKISGLIIIILPLLFVTHPIFAEQFNFTLQSFEVAVSMLGTVISVILIVMYMEYRKNFFVVLSVILSTWSFLTYQSLIMFYISLSVSVIILLLNYRSNTEFSWYAKIVISFLFCFVFSMVFSQLIVIIDHHVFSIETGDYLSRNIVWGKLPLFEIFSTLKNHFKDILFARGIFYNAGFIISILACLLVLIKKVILKSNFILFEFFCVVLLNICPFMLTFFMGSIEPIRAQMPSLQYVIAFNFLYVAINITTKSFLNVCILLALIISFRQGYTTANLFYSERAKYEEDVIFANRINTQLDSLNIKERDEYSLVLIGRKQVNSNIVIEGETIGHSFFAWDLSTPYGTSLRAIGFMKTLGYNFKIPSKEDCEKGESIKDNMTSFPQKNSILISNNTIFIKLSD